MGPDIISIPDSDRSQGPRSTPIPDSGRSMGPHTTPKFTKRMKARSASPTSENEIPETVQDNDVEAPDNVDEFHVKELVPETSNEPVTDTVIDVDDALPLDEDILNILGEDPNKKTYGEAIHNDITTRWSHITTNGLEKDSKSDLCKFQIPENCVFLEAPKLNPEIKAAVSEQGLKRDEVLEQQQNTLGHATAYLGRALNILIKNNENKEVTKLVSDAGRMFCDLFYTKSISRRHLLQFALNKNTKDIVIQTKVGKYIFGENLHENLKAGKAINKTGTDIKYANPQTSNQAKPTLNSRGPPRYRPQHIPRAGRQLNYRPQLTAQRWPAP